MHKCRLRRCRQPGRGVKNLARPRRFIISRMVAGKKYLTRFRIIDGVEQMGRLQINSKRNNRFSNYIRPGTARFSFSHLPLEYTAYKGRRKVKQPYRR